ncbi:MAG: bifunctional demethylmenaquinone methyltransferase/2-methoxy-6-polyprenyl-1,4-benzoquinol methylase UbiE [Actinomycetota bacterium]|nr:bifunctional demethylmenaquinone methyltransferase/2-methoxy-6-polyprenyl-1,4-benzoquinol methylase UbiE [Actinomycetota bacterium]
MAKSRLEGEYVKDIFCKVSKRYDLTNSILSFGLQSGWKEYAVTQLGDLTSGSYLDICTGTGDLAMRIAEKGFKTKVKAVDFCPDMLAIARSKAAAQNLDRNIDFELADATELPFKDDSFDGASVGFGIRNVDNMEEVFSGMHRVIKPGKRAVCLEFSAPPSPFLSRAYSLYLAVVIPILGGLVGGDFESYRYLASSIKNFPNQRELKKMMTGAGFKEVDYINLNLGIVAVHVGTK